MNRRLIVQSSLATGLLALAACSSSGDGGGGTSTTGGQSAGGASAQAGNAGANAAGGSGNGMSGSSNAGAAQGGAAQGGAAQGGAAQGGAAQGGADQGGAGGAAGGEGGAGGAAQGGMGNLPTTCGMPVVNAAPGNTCYDAAPPALSTMLLPGTDELFAPMMLAQPPGDATRLFVITRDGLVHVIKDGALLPTPFLDLTDVVPGNGGENEFGLLGLAFDPDFQNNGKVWLHYNTPENVPVDSRTASVLVSAANPDVADPATLDELFVVDQPADNHNGGMIAFGNDGCLYVSFGDGGNQNDPDGNGQNTGEPLGSILRLDPATGMAAPGNPGYGDDRIWMYGLRNPWRFSFDRMTHDIYIGDVGQGAWEEIDIAPGGVGDFNFGWDVAEGPDGDQTGKRAAAISHDRGDGSSITGGYVYRGTAIADMVGRYVYGDFKSSNYWVLTYSGEMNGQPTICDEYDVTADLDVGGATAFGEDNAGELYILTLNNGIFKINPG